MCEQLYLMSFWICQLHGRRQRNIRCQHPFLISWIIIQIYKNIHISFLYSIWIFVPYCPTLWKHSHHHCLFKGIPGDLLCSEEAGLGLFSYAEKHSFVECVSAPTKDTWPLQRSAGWQQWNPTLQRQSASEAASHWLRLEHRMQIENWKWLNFDRIWVKSGHKIVTERTLFDIGELLTNSSRR